MCAACGCFSDPEKVSKSGGAEAEVQDQVQEQGGGGGGGGGGGEGGGGGGGAGADWTCYSLTVRGMVDTDFVSQSELKNR